MGPGHPLQHPSLPRAMLQGQDPRALWGHPAPMSLIALCPWLEVPTSPGGPCSPSTAPRGSPRDSVPQLGSTPALPAGTGSPSYPRLIEAPISPLPLLRRGSPVVLCFEPQLTPIFLGFGEGCSAPVGRPCLGGCRNGCRCLNCRDIKNNLLAVLRGGLTTCWVSLGFVFNVL